MAHEHKLVCGGCGNELRSHAQERCTHCGVYDPFKAKANSGSPDSVGTKETPRTIGGLPIEQVLELLEKVAGKPAAEQPAQESETEQGATHEQETEQAAAQ